jgi:hypothetical protein
MTFDKPEDVYARKVSDLLPCPMKGCKGEPWLVQDNTWVECRECGFLTRHKHWQRLPRIPERKFPVMLDYRERKDLSHLVCPTSVPWEFVAQFEHTVERNHGQTLEQLHPRGGLGPEEIMAAATNVSIRKWMKKGQEEAVVALKAAVAEWKEAQGEVGRLRAELRTEKKLHQGDHEILAIVTGMDKAYMWSPAEARRWLLARHGKREPRPESGFEYRKWWLDNSDFRDDTGGPNLVEMDQALLDVANKFGREGWEVCAINDKKHGTRILFKRANQS